MPYEEPGVLLNKVAYEIKNTEPDHEYEMLDKYNQAYEEIKVVPRPPKLPDQQGLPPSSAGDYDITQCPAYVPVTQQGQQAETSLMQPATGTTATIGSSDVMSTGDKDQDGNSGDAKDNETYWNVAAS